MVFKKFRLLGYYPTNRARLKKETEYPQEAKELSSLLKESFKEMPTSDGVDDSFSDDFLEYVFIFKDEDNHLFAYFPKDDTARITDVEYYKDSIKIVDYKYKKWFVPGEPFVINVQGADTPDFNKYPLKVQKIVNIEGLFYYEVIFSGVVVNVKLYPFEVKMLEHSEPRKEIVCAYLGISDNGKIRLVQDRASLIDDLFEVDTTHEFLYNRCLHDYKTDRDYHMIKDEYGLMHRFYGNLPEEKQIFGTKIEFWIKSIHPETKNLNLIYADGIDKYIPRTWFSAEQVFEEIGESDNKPTYFDDLKEKSNERGSNKLLKELFEQYNEKNNLWVFSYMNYIDEVLMPWHIKKHELEELSSMCSIMIKIQRWMAEGSTYLDNFSEETRVNTLLKSQSQINKYERLLKAENIVNQGNQGKFIQEIIDTLNKSGRLVFSKEERIEVLINILRIYPEYMMQNLSETTKLFKLLFESPDILNSYNTISILFILELQITQETYLLRTTVFNTNDIDLNQTVSLYNILILMGIRILSLMSEEKTKELQIRSDKARFFRFLSYLCPKNVQSYAYRCGINSLVGTLDDSSIFSWEMLENFNISLLSQRMIQAPILETNINNNYFFFKDKGKSGLIWLCSTGFVIIPHKHSISYFKRNLSTISEVKTFHHLETLPLSLGTMLPFPEISFTGKADKDYLLWTQITKNPLQLMEGNHCMPPAGERILVQVKSQNQNDNLKDLLFVNSIDNRYDSIDGAIYVKDISKRYISDCRKIYKEGDIFFATVIQSKGNRLCLSIKDDVDDNNITSDNLSEDLNRIIQKECIDLDGITRMDKNFIQELILLIDNRIRRESSQSKREILTEYAYNLSSLASDPKSFYYNFMLRYHAAITQFNNNSGNIDIEFVRGSMPDKFPGVRTRLEIINLLKQANSSDAESFNIIIELSNKDNEIVSNFTSLLLSYMYAQKAHASDSSIREIKKDINTFLEKPNNLDFSSVANDLFINGEDTDIDKGIEEDVLIQKEGIASTKRPAISENKIKELHSNTASNIFDVDLNRLSFDTITYMNLYDANVLSFSKSKIDENISKQIEIAPYAKDGIILMVTRDGELFKLPISSFENKDINVEYNCPINPYKIHYYFVVPTDCYIGLYFKCGDGGNLYLNLSSEIEASTLEEATLIKVVENQSTNIQAFILPNLDDINMDKLIGKITDVKNIDMVTIKQLESFEIFIS